MLTRAFGTTGLIVSALGFGAGHIGGDDLTDGEAERIVHEAIDLGVTLFDTARGYGRSEERIGRALGARRERVLLSTKGGYGIDAVADWTGACIARGIDEALARLRTDRIDVFHLHSCDTLTLDREDITRALEDARNAGKIGISAYSGENESLAAALDRGRFGGIQCSVNVCDQRSLDREIVRARELGVGVIGKRPLANAPWRFRERPIGDYAETYWERLRAMKIEPDLDTAIRFSAFAPGVSSIIVGTKSSAHLRASVESVARGALDDERVSAIRAAFRANDRDWRGQI